MFDKRKRVGCEVCQLSLSSGSMLLYMEFIATQAVCCPCNTSCSVPIGLVQPLLCAPSTLIDWNLLVYLSTNYPFF